LFKHNLSLKKPWESKFHSYEILNQYRKIDMLTAPNKTVE